jgi:arylsulfatase A-like enzyme
MKPAACSVLSAAALAAGLSACGSDGERAVAAPDAPNILVIVTDDQRNGTMRWMPQTRRLLARQGRTYSQGYVTTPLCCPSRASIFSGQYIHNHGIEGNADPGFIDDFDHERTWPAALRDAGYRTGLAGKYLNHWPRDERPPSFDLYSWADHGDARRAGKRTDDMRVADAQRFVRKWEEEDDKPWALTLALHAPHTAYDPPGRYKHLKAGPYPRNAGTAEADLSDKPKVVRELQVGHNAIKESWVGHAQTLKPTDDLIAGLMRELRQTDENRDTLVIFISDNGYMMGEHGLTKKTWPYLESVGVPLIVRWPGHVKADSRSAELVANIDIAATAFDVAGVAPDYTVDGRSLLSGEPRDWLLLEGPRQNEKSPYEAWDAYLDHRNQFILWRDDDGFRELYDLKADPFETESLLTGSDPAAESAAEEYEALIEAARECEGEACP